MLAANIANTASMLTDSSSAETPASTSVTSAIAA